jgi:MFS family permease
VTAPSWLRENPNMPWLLASRGLRSFSQGFLNVVVPLYLVSLGFSGVTLGSMLTLGALGMALTVVAVGLTGDRFGRRRVMMGIAGTSVLGLIGFSLAHSFGWLVLSAILATVGGGGGIGGGGSFGPFLPAEQPLVTESCRPEARNAAFGGFAFVGVLASAAGSCLAVLPGALHAHGWSWVEAYRALFWVSAAVAVGTTLSCIPVRERHQPPESFWPPRHVWSIMGRLSLTGALNGFGWGFMGPLLTYWFYARYHVGPTQIGAVFTIANLLSAVPYLIAAPLARRLGGAVRTTSIVGVIGGLVLLPMALAPTFALAAAFMLLRVVVNAIGVPLRVSFVMGITDNRHRSAMAALSNLPNQITGAFAPGIGTYLMSVWTVAAPMLLASGFQVGNWALYYRLFRREVPPEERGAGVPAGRAAADP